MHCHVPIGPPSNGHSAGTIAKQARGVRCPIHGNWETVRRFKHLLLREGPPYADPVLLRIFGVASHDTLRTVAAPPMSDPGQPDLEAPELRLIYDTAPIGLAFLSPDCRYLQINQRLTEICGISVEDHLGRTVRDGAALADAVENIVRSIMETGEPVTGVEVAGQRLEEAGERTWITYWHPLRDRTAGSSASMSRLRKLPSASGRRQPGSRASGNSIRLPI